MAKGDGGAGMGIGSGSGMGRPLAQRLNNPNPGHNFGNMGPSPEILAQFLGSAGSQMMPPGFMKQGFGGTYNGPRMGPAVPPPMSGGVPKGMLNPSGGLLTGEGMGGGVGPYPTTIGGPGFRSPMQGGPSGFPQEMIDRLGIRF